MQKTGAVGSCFLVYLERCCGHVNIFKLKTNSETVFNLTLNNYEQSTHKKSLILILGKKRDILLFVQDVIIQFKLLIYMLIKKEKKESICKALCKERSRYSRV